MPEETQIVDQGSQETPDIEVQSDVPAEAIEPADGDSTASTAHVETDTTDYKAAYEKTSKELARSLKALGTTQRTYEDKLAALQQAPATHAKTEADPTVHQSLRGLPMQEDEYGDKTYMVNGEWMTPKEALTEQRLSRFEQRELERERNAATQEMDSSINAARQEVLSVTAGAIIAMGAEAFKGLDESKIPTLNKMLLSHPAIAALSAKIDDGSITQDDINAAAKESITELQSLLGAAGEQQIKKNAQHADVGKMKPGMPGTPKGKPWLELTQSERDEVIMDNARRAEQATARR